MRRLHLIALLFTLSAAASVRAQTKALPDGLYLGLRWLRESDAALHPYQRDKALSDYRFRSGLGPQLYYTRRIGRHSGWSVETGGWAFWNKATAMDTAAFKRRAIVLPLMAGLHVNVIHTRRISLFLCFTGGAAYVQHIQQYADRMRVQTGTYGIYGVTAILWFGLKKMPGGWYAGINPGVSYFTLERATLHSVFIPWGLSQSN